MKMRIPGTLMRSEPESKIQWASMSSKNYLGEELLLSLDLQNNYLCDELLLLQMIVLPP